MSAVSCRGSRALLHAARIAVTAVLAGPASAAQPPAAPASVEYAQVVRGEPLEFPRDEGAHPQFRTEWWYVTGWLTTAEGAPLGFQITFFRTRPGVDEDNPSRFAARQLLFAHVALSDPARGALLRAEKASRAGFGLAAANDDLVGGAVAGAVDVHIDDWSLRQYGDRYRASIRGADLALELEFVRTQPPLLHGDRGFSQKGPEERSASYYYSLPQLETRGRVVVAGRERRVTGVSWFDHEWSTSIMDAAARGWDWVGLNLADGGALMAFRMRDAAGGQHWAAATWRAARASHSAVHSVAATHGVQPPQVYLPQQVQWTPLRVWRSARTGVSYPVEWRLSVGDLTLTLEPLLDDQENDARGSTGTLYWEGAVRAYDGARRQVGCGYLELTGYGSRVRF